jgi:hypothetical protein
MGYSPRTISVDHETWERAKEIVKEDTGMTMSKFIEVYLRGVARAKHTRSLRDVVEGTMRDLIETDGGLDAREQLRMHGLVDKIKSKKKK